MATLNIKRISAYNSMFVNLDIIINKENYGKISDGSCMEIKELKPGNYNIYVSALKGIYRSKKILFKIEKDEEIKNFEVGPNLFNDKIPLSVLIQGLAIHRAYYIKAQDESIVQESKRNENAKYSGNINIILALIIFSLPVIFILVNNLKFPYYYQLIGNIILIFGIIFQSMVENIKKVYLRGKYSNNILIILYSCIMLYLTYRNPYLLIYNVFVIIVYLITFFKKSINKP